MRRRAIRVRVPIRIRIGSAASFAAVALAVACGLSVEGSNEPVTANPEASADSPKDSQSVIDRDGGAKDGEGLGADADAGEPLTGFCATFPTAFLCDDFDRGTLNKWDGIQTSNGNTLALSTAQSKTPPSSVLVTTFDSPPSPDSGMSTTCDKAALYKIFTLDFQEAEVSFDIYPTSSTSRSAAATLFMSDTYQIEVAVGQNAFIKETELASAPTQTPFVGDLVPNTWTRVKVRYTRTPTSKLTVLYDNSIKHEKPLASASYTQNHRLYVGDFCSTQAHSLHIDNVVFEKTR